MTDGTTVWILGDQLLREHPALRPGCTVLFIESLERLNQQAYHKQKLTLVLAAMRHYAAHLAAQGYPVAYRTAPSFVQGVRDHLAETGHAHLRTMAAAEYDTRATQHRLVDELDGVTVEVLPNTQFLVERHPPRKAPKLMEPFYRQMRKTTGLLMTSDNQPEGGTWNYDKDNRSPFDGRDVPALPTFVPDDVTRAAMATIDAHCPNALGDTAGFALAVTHAQADAALADFLTHRLPLFGKFEDAMSSQQHVLFHSLLSPLLNIGLLEPLPVAQAAVAAYDAGHAPINAVEGFVRQIIGWREYIYYRYWEQMPDLRTVNAWAHHRPLPAWFWSGDTRMACLQHVIGRALTTGYTHHIERLMVLCNFAVLAELEPQAVNEWFLSCYIDAYEWVMLPNVLGMGLNADGGITATKPYIASANYIHKMSDYCTQCTYNRRKRTGDDACPFNTLYWNFLIKHEQKLRANPRFGPAVLGLKRIADDERQAIQQHAAWLLAHLDQL